ncbi:MAG: S-layer homology domain-containing protein, partial [Oscillospiraceae bacterium]
RLRDFTAAGITEQLLPDSISQVADSYGVAITSNFRFTKNAASISDLSILWAERAASKLVAIPASKPAGKAAAPQLTAERDVLKGIKFYTDAQQNVRFTGAVDVAEMPEATLIDHFDAYVSDSATNEIKAAVLGTTYDATTPEVKTGVTVGGDTVQYTVPSNKSTMYTATETYTDKIEVPAVLPDYETVKKGATTQLQFTVDNRGIHGITALEIKVGGTTTTHRELNLLPGGSILLAADYLVPEDGVVDPEYTVKATFSDTAGAKGTAETETVGRRGASVDLTQATGKVYLNLPDVAITDAKIVGEEGGKRTIQLKLNNHSDADLKEDINSVKVSFFKDVTCAEPFTNTELPPITISSAADLAMLNDGGYSTQFDFNVGAYVKGEKLTEIPESGVAIYCKAEVLDDKGAAQGEPITTDNFASVTCENLQLRSETAVALTSDLAVQDGKTVVTVTLQNNRLSKTTTGNLIVTLLDANGKVLEQQQSYQGERRRSGNGLITLTGEEKQSESFTFKQPGASVQTTYSDVLLANDNAKLSSISFTTIPGITLASFTESQKTPGTYTAQVSTNDLTATTVIAVTESGYSKAKVVGTAGTASNAISQEVSLTPGENTTITVTVTAQNKTVNTYLLTVQNKLPQPDGGGAGSGGGADSGGSGGGGGDSATAHPIHVAQSPHGTVSVSPRSAFPGDTVTITAVPEKGYQPEAVALVLQNGKELTAGKQSEGRYSFKMPDCAVNVTVSFVPQTCDGGDKCPSRSFTDVDQSLWYHSAIDYAVAHKFFSGTGATNFTPNGTMTRGMLVTVLYRAAGKPSMEHEIWGYPFADVDVNSYCGTAVYWARLHEIVGGYAGGERFGPNDPVTREQMAAILYRYALSEGRDVTARTDLTKFTDSASIGSYAKTALSWACANGFLQGSDGALLPQNNATRAQVAAVLMRYSRSAPVK